MSKLKARFQVLFKAGKPFKNLEVEGRDANLRTQSETDKYLTLTSASVLLLGDNSLLI